MVRQISRSPEWVDEMIGDLRPSSFQVKESLGLPRRIPLTRFGPVGVEWILREQDIVYHIYRAEDFSWPVEARMREILGEVFEELLGSSSDARASYTEEMDSWAIKLRGYSNRGPSILEVVTADFGVKLAEKLEAA